MEGYLFKMGCISKTVAETNKNFMVLKLISEN